MIITILVAMLLSTASARTLKMSDDDINCNSLIICVPEELKGNKTLTAKNYNKHGEKIRDWGDTDAGYCAVFIQTLYGPDIDVEFYLDGIMVHVGNYQQNLCYYEAGAIHTNDSNAETHEGDSDNHRPGYVFIRSWK